MSPIRRELGALWRLAWPLVVTQVGVMMLGVVDTLLLGRLSVEALDAVALANMWGWATLGLGMGVVAGMDPLVSQAYGAGDAEVAALVWVAQPLALVAIIRLGGLHKGAWRPWDRRAVELSGLAQVIRLGVPIGLQLSFEGSAWSLAAMMAGWLGASALAGHTIVLNMIALWFQVPLGISMAASVRVGNLLGAGDLLGARLSGSVSLAPGARVMLIAASAFVLFRSELPLLFTSDPGVVALAAANLPIAGAFQVFDGTQVVAGGLLRGAGRTRAPALANLLGYYTLALPLGAWLGSGGHLGLAGIWWALLVGLVIVSSLMLFWLRRASHLPL